MKAGTFLWVPHSKSMQRFAYHCALCPSLCRYRDGLHIRVFKCRVFMFTRVLFMIQYWGHSQIWKLINKEKSTNNILVFVILMQFPFIFSTIGLRAIPGKQSRISQVLKIKNIEKFQNVFFRWKEWRDKVAAELRQSVSIEIVWNYILLRILAVKLLPFTWRYWNLWNIIFFFFWFKGIFQQKLLDWEKFVLIFVSTYIIHNIVVNVKTKFWTFSW